MKRLAMNTGGRATRIFPRAFAVAWILLLPILGGCSGRSVTSGTAAYQELDRYEENSGTGSLFGADHEVLSDEDIARILGHSLETADRNRLAVLKLRTARHWSDNYAEVVQKSVTPCLNRLSASSRVIHAAQLPMLLVPEKKTVPHLREAAARYQADLLLVYDTAVRTFTDYGLFGNHKARAQCSVEAVLLDVRTGIVPFTSAQTEEITVKETDEDMNLSEAIAKAVAVAEGRALDGIAQETVVYLEGR